MKLFTRKYLLIFSKSFKDSLKALQNVEPDSDSDVETEKPPRKVARKTSSSQRFRWSQEMVESVLQCLMEIKSQYEFRGLDFEADLVWLYTDVRVLMAQKYEEFGEFGPVSVTDIEDGLTTEEVAKVKGNISEERKRSSSAMIVLSKK